MRVGTNISPLRRIARAACGGASLTKREIGAGRGRVFSIGARAATPSAAIASQFRRIARPRAGRKQLRKHKSKSR
jgi:hypothetical protein